MCRLALVLIARLALTFGAKYCPSGQRYDASQFPPTCVDCPRIVPNRINLTHIQTAVQVSRKAKKFSPGLPQNSTCGCWSTNTTSIDVALDASEWIVSGLAFASDLKGRWLQKVRIKASHDNRTFIPWGTYTAPNASASIAMFSYPIRARFFRVEVLQYANHLINDSKGFPLAAWALVSRTEPFTCDCPLLSDGKCCPFMNMTVRNDRCVWCMDPTRLSTAVVKGCGQCKPGTFEHQGQCVQRRTVGKGNRIVITDTRSDGSEWTARLNIDTDERSELGALILTGDASHLDQPPATFVTILRIQPENRAPLLSPQYILFDRGRSPVLNMTRDTIHKWALCDAASCTGQIGAGFITRLNDGRPRWAWAFRPLRFGLTLPGLVALVPAQQAIGGLELHAFFLEDMRTEWKIRVLGARLSSPAARVQWDDAPPSSANTTGDFLSIDPPPDKWACLRVTDGVTSLALYSPIKVVEHGSATRVRTSHISVRIRYGLGLSTDPSPGDSEQLVSIMAKGPRPIRLKTLSVEAQGLTTMYTTPKGFITDPARVLDVGVTCLVSNPDTLALWITRSIAILHSSAKDEIERFVQAACQSATMPNVKMYWLVHRRLPISRQASMEAKTTAEFI